MSEPTFEPVRDVEAKRLYEDLAKMIATAAARAERLGLATATEVLGRARVLAEAHASGRAIPRH